MASLPLSLKKKYKGVLYLFLPIGKGQDRTQNQFGHFVKQKILRSPAENQNRIRPSCSIVSRTELSQDLFNPSAWSDGHYPHAARSHSFVYISTS